MSIANAFCLVTWRGKGESVDRQEWNALLAQLRALEAKYAAEAAGQPATDAAPPRTLEARRVEAAFLEIALLCKQALKDRAVPVGVHAHFLQIASVCRGSLQR
jgi:hypothetical protein